MKINYKSILLKALALLCCSPVFLYQASHATVADGVRAYESGNYRQAHIEWLPYAALGNPNALYNLGQLYRMGRGVEIDYNKAKDYYLRAAEKRHIGAQRNLGTLYYFGRVNDIEHKQALIWLTKAAINGDDRSQLMIGTMYLNGETGEKDYIKSYAWVLLAANSGISKASTILAKLNDVMAPNDIIKAKKLSLTLITQQIAPDNAGLMIKQKATDIPSEVPESPLLKITQTEQDSPQQVIQEDAEEISHADNSTPINIRDKFHIQLGSFRTEKSAEAALKKLKNKFPYIPKDKKGNIEFIDLGEKGIFYRLQLSPFSNRALASELCGQLKENKQNCFVVKTP